MTFGSINPTDDQPQGLPTLTIDQLLQTSDQGLVWQNQWGKQAERNHFENVPQAAYPVQVGVFMGRGGLRHPAVLDSGSGPSWIGLDVLELLTGTNASANGQLSGEVIECPDLDEERLQAAGGTPFNHRIKVIIRVAMDFKEVGGERREERHIMPVVFSVAPHLPAGIILGSTALRTNGLEVVLRDHIVTRLAHPADTTEDLSLIHI